MTLSDITNRQFVMEAINEFDRLKRDQFLNKYGFGRSRSYWLVHEGRRYDSKAIIGAAHGFARPDLGPLSAADFTGGEASVQRKLEELGFTVEVDDTAPIRAESTSVKPHRKRLRFAGLSSLKVSQNFLCLPVERHEIVDQISPFIDEDLAGDSPASLF